MYKNEVNITGRVATETVVSSGPGGEQVSFIVEASAEGLLLRVRCVEAAAETMGQERVLSPLKNRAITLSGRLLREPATKEVYVEAATVEFLD